MVFFPKTIIMKTTTKKITTWKNITTLSLVVLSIISIISISVSIANYDKLKVIEDKINLIQKSLIK